jgi:hypothetical protein
MLTGSGTLHGWSHTYAGATPIAAAAALSGKYLGELGLRFLRLGDYNPISWRTAVASAFIGTWSHVFIDGIMHADMAPLAPLSEARLLYGIIGVDTLHLLCLVSAVLGAAGYFAVRRLRKL